MQTCGLINHELFIFILFIIDYCYYGVLNVVPNISVFYITKQWMKTMDKSQNHTSLVMVRFSILDVRICICQGFLVSVVMASYFFDILWFWCSCLPVDFKPLSSINCLLLMFFAGVFLWWLLIKPLYLDYHIKPACDSINSKLLFWIKPHMVCRFTC